MNCDTENTQVWDGNDDNNKVNKVNDDYDEDNDEDKVDWGDESKNKIEGCKYKSVNKFEEMNLKEELLRAIYGYGWEKPSYVQCNGIIPVIKGRDAVVQAQSGTGKTGTFTISCLEVVDTAINSCQCIILNPTREIADQTLRVITNLSIYLPDINICGVIGGKRLSNEEVSLAHVLVATPGRIYDMINRGIINMETLKLFIVDEADSMLSRGFKEQIIEIFKYVPKTSQVAIYSATMPVDVLDMTKEFMNNPIRILVKKDDLTLKGIKQFYITLETEKEKYETLCDIYKTLTISQSMIYCATKKKVEWLADQLESNGFPVSKIHGDMIQTDRDDIMKKFRNGSTRVLITTDLLARGIDVQQVSLVINYDLPKEKESYIHRIGRSGRYGRKGVAINFVMSQYDIRALKDIESFYVTNIEEMPMDVSK
jgi:translation initiation factor 4A